MLRRAPLLLTLSLLAGCAIGGASRSVPPAPDPAAPDLHGITLQITSPAQGALLGTPEVEVQGTTNAPEVTVGGTTVEVVDGRFATVVDLAEGPNTIVARAEEREETVTVTVDSSAPVVTIVSPALASFVEGNVLEVRGRVADDNLASVEIEGEHVEVSPDGSFIWSGEVAPGAHRVRVIARDELGNVGTGFTTALVGAFAAPGDAIASAASLHAGPRALAAIGDGVEPYLAPAYLRPMLLARNPIVSGGWGRLEALGETHGRTTVTVTPRTGSLEIRVRLEDIEVPLKAFINWFPDITGTAYVDAAVATVVATVRASGGRPVVTIASTDVALEGLLVDVDGLWSWIDRNIVTAAVRGKIESTLDALAARYVPPAVEGAIERIPLSHSFTVMDEPARVSASVESLRVSSGGLDASFGIGIHALDPHPDLAYAPGSILLDVGDPPSEAETGLRASVSLDLVNAALFAGWSTGRMELFMRRPSVDGEPVTVGFLGLIAPGVRSVAPPEAPINAYVWPALPPVVEAGEDGELIVRVNDLRVIAVAETDGGEIELFEISIGVTAPVRISAADNEVSVALGDLELVADSVRGAPLPVGDSLDAALAGLVGPIPETFTTLSGLELPQLYGFGISDYRADLADGYLTFRGTLRAL